MTAGSFMQLIAERARRDPGAIALLAPGRPPLDYAGLLRAVNATVKALAAAGLGRGSRIGVALPNGPEMAVMLLAVTDCATCAPLNPAMDAATSRYLLDRMRIDALVVPAGENSPAREMAQSLALPIVEIAFARDDPAGAFALTTQCARLAVVATVPQPEDTVLLLHTSGTTAQPKVVPSSSRHLVDSARLRAERMRITERDRCLLVAPLFLASGIRRDLFPILGAGGSVICAPGFDAGSFLDWLETFQPTFYSGSPTVQRAVQDALRRRGRTPRHALRFVIATSAPLPGAVQEGLEHALGVPVLPAYAATETGLIALAAPPPGQRRAGSVGQPAPGQVAILGQSGSFLAVGETGEVVVRGAEVFAGYENDPAATRQAFHDLWCRTGDQGYLDRDGHLFLCGRLKELINRGGLKVSPLEVDAALERHPDVAEAAAYAVPHPTLGEDVAAAVVLRTPGSVTTQQLRDFALAELAPFKVPSHIRLIDVLPRTALGKLRRGELAAARAPRPPFRPPDSLNETLVASLYAEVLDIGRVGAFDNFFELGGDSLRAAQVTARVNTALDLDLQATALFRRPAVAEFAAELDAHAGRDRPRPAPRLVRRTHAILPPASGEPKA